MWAYYRGFLFVFQFYPRSTCAQREIYEIQGSIFQFYPRSTKIAIGAGIAGAGILSILSKINFAHFRFFASLCKLTFNSIQDQLISLKTRTTFKNFSFNSIQDQQRGLVFQQIGGIITFNSIQDQRIQGRRSILLTARSLSILSKINSSLKCLRKLGTWS